MERMTTVVPSGAGAWPIWPMPKAWFWPLIASVNSGTVIPICASRSGFSQIRIATSGIGNITERLAPGRRFTASRT